MGKQVMLSDPVASVLKLLKGNRSYSEFLTFYFPASLEHLKEAISTKMDEVTGHCTANPNTKGTDDLILLAKSIAKGAFSYAVSGKPTDLSEMLRKYASLIDEYEGGLIKQ